MPHILVVDDDLPICEVLASAFADEGWSVQTCTRPEDALEPARQWSVDAIVLDLKLPGMGAASFLAAYREQARSSTPVIVLSATSDLVGHAARLGATSALNKPFDIDTLCDTIRRCLVGDFAASGASDGR
jgi:two-component system, OmpR family, response regulator CpxR